MTGPNGRAAAPLELWDAAPLPGRLQPDVALALRTLGDKVRLDVLQRLAAGEQEPEEIAEALGLSAAVVRSHLLALEAAGLVRPGSGLIDVYQLTNHAVSLLKTTLAYSAGAGRAAQPGKARRRASVLPSAPLACTLCDNRNFVSGVLGDLEHALREARDYHGRIQEMSSQVLTAHEAERKRIARELHDDTAQALTSILVRLRLLERTAHDQEVLENVEELRELTSGALDSVRRMAMDLRPAALDDLGLVPALQAYAERFSEHWATKATVTVDGLRRRLPADVELVLYRVVQEALTNIAKHSSASLARVSLSRRRNEVTLLIQDNGVGFESGEKTQSNGHGLGLFGMSERLGLVGGNIRIESARGRGTTITAHVPVGLKRGSAGRAP